MTFADVVVQPLVAGGDRPQQIVVPADKSIAHRLGMLCGVGSGRTQIENYPLGADNQSTLDVMAQLGAQIKRGQPKVGGQPVEIGGCSGPLQTAPGTLDCGNSGTTVRLLLGLVAGAGVTATFDGDASLRKRPMRRVTDHLQQMGARIEELGASPGVLPIRLQGGDLQSYECDNVKASAQVKSAILLAGLAGGVDVVVHEPRPSRDHSERLLHYLGYQIATDTNTVRLRGHGIDHENPESVTIPGDLSSAAFWLALSVLTGRPAQLPGVGVNATRDGVLQAVDAMGATVSRLDVRDWQGEPVADLSVAGRLERGVEIGGEAVVQAIDELPLLALMGLFLPPGETVYIRDAGELRVKETDRIDATVAVAKAFGGAAESGEDWLRVGPPDTAAESTTVTVDAAHDHRIAMAAAVVGVAAGRTVRIVGGDVAKISYPSFWQDLQRGGWAEVETGT